MKVLVVEDNEDSRLLQLAALTGFGHVVETAGNGREALDRLRVFAPDVIVSDLLMPEMDGFELCRTLKSDPALRHIPFIVYTATYVEPKDEALVKALGAARFVLKPVEPTEFLRVIREVVEQAQRHPAAEPDRVAINDLEFTSHHGERVTRKLDKKLLELDAHSHALAEVESSYRLLVESLDDVVFQTDRRLRWTFLNSAWTRLLGYPIGDALGRDVVDYVHSDDHATCRALLGAGLGDAVKDDTRTCRFMTREGAPRWFGFRVRATRAESGRIVGVSGVLRDVTLQQQALVALQASEEKYRRLVDLASDAILVIETQHGRIVDVNARLEVLTGHPRESLLGQHFTRLHPERMSDVYLGLFEEIVARGGTACKEMWIRRVDGELVLVETSASVIEWRGQHGLQQIMRDVSQRLREEERMRPQSEAFRGPPEGIVITGPDLEILSVNPAFTAITGYREDEVLGKTPAVLKSGHHDQSFYQAMWAAIEDSDYWRGEIWNRNKAGGLYAERLTISAVRDAQGRIVYFVGVFTDVGSGR